MLVELRRRRRARRRRRRATFLAGDGGRAEVADDLAFAAEAGITAVPTYVIDGRWSIPGAQDPAVFVQVLQRLARPRNVTADGLTRRAAAAPGPAVVLVHGFTQTGRSWDPVADHLADRLRGRRRSTLPGHGGSADVEADLVAGAALLGATAGRATYVGYSMGGRLCLHLAVARPELVERLVLVSATAASTTTGPGRPGGRATSSWRRRSSATAWTRSSTGWVAQPMFAGLADPGLDDRRRNTAAGLASSLRLAGTGTQEPLWDRLPALTMPVLLVAGALDPKFVAAAERMAGLIPHVTLAVVDGAGHTVHLERRRRSSPSSTAGSPRHGDRFPTVD